ncbi:MAG: hypothetical protein M3389_00200 [Actinomycetota bacterium]|nr:hypothetical protein [Actinomycetota bacterium]
MREDPDVVREDPDVVPDRPTVALPAAAYAYLLGMYLGDGHIARRGRSIELRIYCDAAYPRIVEEVRTAIRTVRPGANVWSTNRPHARCLVVASGWRAWPAVIPQNGPGRKHARPIRLAPWQLELTRAEPDQLVRGLLHSDGCRYVARQRCGDRVYSYVRYPFSNRSDDIRRIFCEHLQLLGIGWTHPSRHGIAIDRRAEVAKLEEFVGPKR